MQNKWRHTPIQLKSLITFEESIYQTASSSIKSSLPDSSFYSIFWRAEHCGEQWLDLLPTFDVQLISKLLSYQKRNHSRKPPERLSRTVSH